MHPLEFQPDSLPWSPEAESSVLGALLLDNGSWDRVGDILISSQFFDERNGRVFTAVASLINSCKPADVITVFEHLQTTGQSNGIDLMFVHELSTASSSSHAIRRYAEIIAERSLMRSLMAAADDVKAIAVATGTPVAERLDKAQARLQELQVHRSRSMPVPIQDFVVNLLDHITDMNDGKVAPGIPTRIPTLDRMLGGGLKPGKQIILAARPSVGKSSLGEQICINLAMDGHAAAMFSQEMPGSELTERAVANIGCIALDRLSTGKLEDGEWTRLTEAIDTMRTLPLHFDDQPALTLMDISAKARMLKRQHDVKLIVIDYLQLCSSGKPGDSRHHQIEAMSRGLKNLARQLDITIITLSQLNRDVEKRTTGRAVLSDLKESGAIEEDADVVILLNKHGDNQDGSRSIACDVPKNRQGRTGELGLHFDGAHQRWTESAQPLTFKKPATRHYTEEA